MWEKGYYKGLVDESQINSSNRYVLAAEIRLGVEEIDSVKFRMKK